VKDTVVAAVFDWAETDPDRIALEYNDEIWTYARFAEAIAKARAHFRRHGIEGGGIAALVVRHVREAWVLSAALRSLGVTTVALQSPGMIADLGLAGLRWVVARGGESWTGLAEACADVSLPLVVADYAAETPLPLSATGHQQAGHILQTSGTTGRYKKIFMDPAWEPGFLRHRREVSGASERDVVCLFDFGLWTGMGYKSPSNLWIVGGVTIFNQGRPPHLVLHRPGMTNINMVPTMLAEILAQPEGAFPYSATADVGIGGGTVTQREIDESKRRIGPVLTNGLGATESNTIAITPIQTPDDHRWHIPDPSSNVQIVDDGGRPVPPGEIGRLRVATDGGPTSYLDDEEATQTFFQDGFFYTGDLAVMREDGRIALMGRFTDVINVNGHKIQPAPIEDRLRDALGVTGVCLLSMQDGTGEEGLHVVVETPAQIDAAALQPALSREISGFGGVRVHFLPAMPRNAMGKIVRRELAQRLAAAGAKA
jgi:acyl-coenzyme A synthetase/AMP-(fatty) acid ligase